MREELLNVLMHCFLQAKSVKEYDEERVLREVLRLLTDQKDKVKNVAIETFVVFTHLRGFHHLKAQLQQIVDQYTFGILLNRLEANLVPFIDQEGSLVMPYIDNYESSSVYINESSLVLPNLSRRDSSAHSAHLL